jgi:hypothetical protein
MRIVEFAATGLLVPFASAQSVSPKLASIIPPDTALIYSIDLERYADSALQSFYPMAEESAGQCTGKLRQIIIAERTPTTGGGKLIILRGVNVAPGCASADETNDTVSAKRQDWPCSKLVLHLRAIKIRFDPPWRDGSTRLARAMAI